MFDKRLTLSSISWLWSCRIAAIKESSGRRSVESLLPIFQGPLLRFLFFHLLVAHNFSTNDVLVLDFLSAQQQAQLIFLKCFLDLIFFSWISNSYWAELESNFIPFPPSVLVFKFLILEVLPLQDVMIWTNKAFLVLRIESIKIMLNT